MKKNATVLLINILMLNIIISPNLTCQDALSAQIISTPAGKCKGVIDFAIQNGHPLYEVAWVGPIGSYPRETSTGNDGHEDLNDLCAGIYCVTVTDELCGTATASFEVEECPFIDLSGTTKLSQPPSNCNEHDGWIRILDADARINGFELNRNTT